MPTSISPGAVKDTEFLSPFGNRKRGAIARQQKPERRRMKKNFCSAIIPSSRNWSPVYWVEFELQTQYPEETVNTKELVKFLQQCLKSMLIISFIIVAVIGFAGALLFLRSKFPQEIDHLCDIITALGTAISAGCAWLALSISRQLVQGKKSNIAEEISSEKTTAKIAGVEPTIEATKSISK